MYYYPLPLFHVDSIDKARISVRTTKKDLRAMGFGSWGLWSTDSFLINTPVQKEGVGPVEFYKLTTD